MLAILASFFVMVVLDFVWARYTYHLMKKHPSIAGAYASAIVLLTGVCTIMYVNNNTLLIAAALGAFVGTFIAVIHERRSQRLS